MEPKPVVVVPGGPGFDARYLRRALLPWSTSFIFSFTDDASNTTDVATKDDGQTLAGSVQLLSKCLRSAAHDGHVRVVVHSWGVVPLLHALRALPEVKVGGLIVTPVPTNWDQFDVVRHRLLSRFPPQILEVLADTSLRRFGPEQIAAALPYYVSPRAVGGVTNLHFDLGQYRSVLASSVGYNVREMLGRLRNCSIVLGADDFILPSDVEDVLAVAHGHYIIPNAGHFPFFEQPELFSIALHSALTL